MDVYIFISVLSVMYSWILCTVLSAPAGETPVASAVTQRRHVRTKRCSCSTFLDKECVYFCHLDIIWVNTPERVVSYGLGDAPRTRRAAPGSMATGGGPRCRCRSGSDHGCGDFCRTDSRTRYEASPDATSGSAGGDGCTGTRCKHKLAADAGGVKRVRDGDEKQASPLALRAAARTRLLLEKWRVRQRHRARTWEGESTAS